MVSIPRLRRPWGDVRFLIGVLLIVVAIVGVWLIVSSSRQTAPALQATRTIVPGEALSSADVRVVDVSLGTVAPTYLTPTTLEPGAIATRTIEDGELIAVSSTAPADAGRTTAVVVESAVGIPGAVAEGAVVEVWYAPPSKEGKGFDPPRILLEEAVVAGVTRADGLLGGSQATLELIVDRSSVGDVLAAVADGAALSVVPLRSGS
ncbi:hypothetical protein J2Y69_000960 [Microbacterium resistens]|uniref:SAF domain-containing protein n=1 Tax=Microbacterium resistens TaxID=156977 RepID=A0ABU1S9T7_9MICO|nr:SAF domain-containing protein [Microbacterium resistens]MDR6866368.1 hypothetical protein [Microbacterium resistens]